MSEEIEMILHPRPRQGAAEAKTITHNAITEPGEEEGYIVHCPAVSRKNNRT